MGGVIVFLIVAWITCEGIHAVKSFSLHLNSLSKKVRSWSHLEMISSAVLLSAVRSLHPAAAVRCSRKTIQSQVEWKHKVFVFVLTWGQNRSVAVPTRTVRSIYTVLAKVCGSSRACPGVIE